MRNFRNTVGYDPALNIWDSKEGRKRLAILKNASPEMRALWIERGRQSGKKKRDKKAATREEIQKRREIAEENCAETIRVAVSAIQHALLMLQSVPAPSQYRKCVNPSAVHNAIFQIKNKGGITFPASDAEFDNHISLDRPELGTGVDNRQKYIPLWERD